PRGLRPLWPKPLEAICLKAMALRPVDRYSSPQALADDIERYLADEPVAAYRDPPIATAARWARKHRATVATAAAALVTATMGLSLGLVLISVEKNRTELARNEAQQRESELRQVVRFIERKILAAARP